MYDTIIEVGVIFLLIYAPLAFGGVSQGSVALMEMVVGSLMLVWLAKLISQRHRFSHKSVDQRGKYHLRMMTSSLFIPLALLLGLIALQLIPLPSFLVRLLSPTTYQIYTEAARVLDSPLPTWIPLTVCSYATGKELYKLLMYFAVFFLIINNIRSPKQIKRLVYVIIAIGLFESLYGMMEYFSGRHQIFFYKKQTSFSVSGTFVNKNHFAGYMEMVIPLTFSILFARLGEGSQTASKKIVRFVEEKYMKVLLVGFLLAVMITAILLSGSRGGFISFVGGMFCLIILTYNRRLLRKRAVVVLVLLLFSAGIAMILGYDLIVQRLQALTELENVHSVQFRLKVWKGAFRMFQDFPVWGAGLGTFASLFPSYQTFISDLFVSHTENEYLQALAEIGIIGGLLGLWIGCLYFYTTLKAWKNKHSRWSIVIVAGGISAMVSLLIHSWVDFNLHIPSNALLFSVIAALNVVAIHSHRRSLQ